MKVTNFGIVYGNIVSFASANKAQNIEFFFQVITKTL
jgi:hypothetical protein